MNADLLERIVKSPKLPTMPAVAMAVVKEIEREGADPRGIVEIVKYDPALSGKILKVVNSAFFGIPTKVGTLDHALVLLGLERLKTLALGFTIVKSWTSGHKQVLDPNHYWTHTLYSAVASRAAAREFEICDRELCFMAGLLQNIGMLAMAQAIESYPETWARAGESFREVRRHEESEYGLSHAIVGSHLAEAWNLPEPLIEAIRHHEEPGAAPASARGIVRCVAFGSWAADVFVGPDPGVALQGFQKLGREWFELSPFMCDTLLSKVSDQAREASELLELPVGQLPDPEEILTRANEALLSITMRQYERAEVLVTDAQRFASRAVMDPLCHVANRARFDDYLESEFRQAQATRSPLSLIMMDLDEFKRVNDMRSHIVGDRTLVTVARAVNEMMPPVALFARYGGEEFAAVLPRTGLAAAAEFAGRLREAVQTAPIPTREGAFHVTASFGVATFDGECFEDVTAVVQAADTALYEAKRSGRNCVRAYGDGDLRDLVEAA